MGVAWYWVIALTLILCGCATSQGLPITTDSYCQVASKHYPVTLSRKDTAETKRQVAVLNTTYENICGVKEPKK